MLPLSALDLNDHSPQEAIPLLMTAPCFAHAREPSAALVAAVETVRAGVSIEGTFHVASTSERPAYAFTMVHPHLPPSRFVNILYFDPEYLAYLELRFQSLAAVHFTIAHELAHTSLGHNWTPNSRSDAQIRAHELEANHFTGARMHQLGWGEQETLQLHQAMLSMDPLYTQETALVPPLELSIKATLAGWKEAGGKLRDVSPSKRIRELIKGRDAFRQKHVDLVRRIKVLGPGQWS